MIKDCNAKEGEYVRFKRFERRKNHHLQFMQSLKAFNGKQNRDESCTNKHQKHVAFSYGYKLVCVDDKFSKPFKAYLGIDTFYNFINSTIEKFLRKSILTKNF